MERELPDGLLLHQPVALEGGDQAAPTVGRTWRLDQLMLAGTVSLVTLLVVLSGMLQALASRKEFDDAAATQRASLQQDARNAAHSVALQLATTSAAALRDNDFAFIANLASSLVATDPNIVHTRVLDGQGHIVADSAGARDIIAELRLENAAEVSFAGQRVERYATEVKDSKGRHLGAVLVDYSLAPLQAGLARVDRARAAAMQHIELRTLILGIGFTLCGMIVAAFQSRRVTKPLAALTSGALRLANGELDARVPPMREAGSEVLTLGTVFNHLADQISLLLERTRETAKLEHDVQVARAVQETFLPTSEPIEIGSVRLAGKVAAADNCGGDWWSYERIDERHFALCTGDVTGHGVAAALVAAAACSSFVAATAKHADSSRRSASAILSEINRTLHAMYRGKYQMTCVAGVLDVVSGVLEVARAAHPFPMIVNRNTLSYSSIMPTGPHLGEASEVRFERERVQLKSGDLVLWFSDGVVEAENGSGVYGTKRLRSVIGRSPQLPVAALRDAVLADVLAFAGGVRADDMTLVIAEYVAPGAPAAPMGT
jgi:sigma-B regulation protein RsbU (phosphoserine phosphatase)